MTHIYRGKMIHGNKKYFFNELAKAADTLLVTPKNIYSLKNQAKLYIKETDPNIKFDYEEQKGGKVLITRIS